MKQLTAICFCLVLVVIGPVKALADDFGTLVYVVGEVEIRKKSSHFWAVSKSGDRLDTGDVVKTAVNSTALLLNPDGSLTVVSEARKRSYRPYGHGATRELNLALGRFFDKIGLRRYDAFRGSVFSQRDWMRLIRKDKFSAKDLELSFEMINRYNREGKKNRVSALLLKLKEVFPENPGFYQLAKLTLTGRQPRVDWQVMQIIDGKSYTLDSGSKLTDEDTIRIRYFKSEESYYYLFSTSQWKSGSISSRMVYPKSITSIKKNKKVKYFESRKGAREAFNLSLKTKDMSSNNNLKKEHFWGWSCNGPLIDEKDVRAAVKRVEHHIDQNRFLADDIVTQVAPALCQSSFSLSLEFVKRQSVAYSPW